ncbi:hypothetical protein [Rhizobium rhizogenes]|uniref:hypothetical protein n=1 Tax=Rhizobium rhizogenes TaxID=359 RepID=UPI001573B24E|nr:hypothetical protein [Rhizobium rhizogenes]NTF42654.1 hypothetical protein [Rhizobium rhizogenes]
MQKYVSFIDIFMPSVAPAQCHLAGTGLPFAGNQVQLCKNFNIPEFPGAARMLRKENSNQST